MMSNLFALYHAAIQPIPQIHNTRPKVNNPLSLISLPEAHLCIYTG